MTVPAGDDPTGNAAMDAISAPKSPQTNRLEGFVLTALFQGFPTFAAAALMLKLVGSHEIVGHGAAIVVVLAALFYALLMPWLGRKFPNRFRHGYEPLFFDASLSQRKDRALAHPAGDLAATGDQRNAAVAAGGGRGERGVRV
jgi:hypothetical protein